MSKIALLVYDVTLTGGAERVALNLAGEFAKTDKVYIISIAMEDTSEDGEIRGNLDCLPKSVRFLSLSKEMGSITMNFLKYKKSLKEILKREQIDVLLSITAGVVTLACAAARRTKTKVVFCEHSNLENMTYGKKHVFRQHYGADLADAVVTLTRRDRINYMRLFKTPKDRLFTIPNWFTPLPEPPKYDIKSKKIISVGRLEEVKGYEYTIACAEKILKNNPDWEWDIYGDGSLRDELQKIIDERHIERLTLKGNATDIRERYAGYAFLVMTSRYEGFPLSLLEAQVSGLPIVSFDCPTGPSEIVTDNVNGFIVRQFDVEELTKKVQRLITSDKLRSQFSGHAGDNLQQYSKERVLRQWRRLFVCLKIK